MNKTDARPARDALAELYYDRIYVYCRSRLPSDEAAEDAVQEVFAAFAAKKELSEPDVVLKWLYRVARNKTADYFRGLDKEPLPLEDAVLHSGVENEPELSGAELEEKLERVMSALQEAEVRLLREVFAEKVPYSLLAERYSLSEGALRVRICRLRHKIVRLVRECLE